MPEQAESILDEPRQFIKESQLLLNRCTKPDRKEYIKVAQAVSMGFFVMGFIGFFVKLIHIPINNIIVGGA
ncbi:protein translocation complex subunit SSS1 [Thamnocephalis sphaerospora]|uniref:Protein translocation complex subunit SSS1 n=1 Tax=Thamnocephalis sphaerospora TaxID=78915 RepID=A0A4P9XQF3_9FUNG|nr:protein translocation complex subunit SSS1 [Thamnocephalis sphaerospora]|eukprot:RKP08258.1 protein translocation complex subunit SSS1 [Thamnocephalis sphaerospora]